MSGPRSTSSESHRELILSGTAKFQREIIIEFMERHQLPRNRREIALLTGTKINAVTGRVNTLVKSGELIEEHYCFDVVTNRRVWYVELPQRIIRFGAVQSRMF